MAIYDEKKYSWWKALLILTVAFLLLYAPWNLGKRELHGDEVDYASMAKEMEYFPPLTVIHGQLVHSFPMYPSIISFVFKTELPKEFSLRIISVVALVILTFLVWEATRTVAGQQAAIVAAAVMVSSLIVIEKTIDGYPEMLGILFVCSAWLAWFNIGAGRSRWSLAWIFSFFFCGVAFYTMGWPAICYTFFPMLFMRRPLTVWQKLKKPGFWLGLLLLSSFILFWGLPRWAGDNNLPFSGLNAQDNSYNQEQFNDYFQHLITFPFEIICRFLPWSLLAWAPFCVAFHPLDKSPIFSRFLRTLFLSLFVLLWLSPFTEARDLMILTPPLAIMIGINYWLLVRRYGDIIHILLTPVTYSIVALAFLVSLLFILPVNVWSFMTSLAKYQPIFKNYALEGFLHAVLALLVGVGLIMMNKTKVTVAFKMLFICVGFGLLFWSVIHTSKVHDKYSADSKSNFGKTMREAIGDNFNPEVTIFKRKVRGLYGGCFYIGCKIRQIKEFDELPNDGTVYLLSTEYPIFTQRIWTEIGNANYKMQNLKLYKGITVDQKTKPDSPDNKSHNGG